MEFKIKDINQDDYLWLAEDEIDIHFEWLVLEKEYKKKINVHELMLEIIEYSKKKGFDDKQLPVLEYIKQELDKKELDRYIRGDMIYYFVEVLNFYLDFQKSKTNKNQYKIDSLKILKKLVLEKGKENKLIS